MPGPQDTHIRDLNQGLPGLILISSRLTPKAPRHRSRASRSLVCGRYLLENQQDQAPDDPEDQRSDHKSDEQMRSDVTPVLTVATAAVLRRAEDVVLVCENREHNTRGDDQLGERALDNQ